MNRNEDTHSLTFNCPLLAERRMKREKNLAVGRLSVTGYIIAREILTPLEGCPFIGYFHGTGLTDGLYQ